MLSLDPAVIDRSSPIPGERRLWAAVLCQAVRDLMGVNTYAHGSYRSTLQHFTRLWIESDSKEPGSFCWICDQLELDPGWLRRRLLEMAGKNADLSTSPVKAVDSFPAEGSVQSQPEMAIQLPRSSPDLITYQGIDRATGNCVSLGVGKRETGCCRCRRGSLTDQW